MDNEEFASRMRARRLDKAAAPVDDAAMGPYQIWYMKVSLADGAGLRHIYILRSSAVDMEGELEKVLDRCFLPGSVLVLSSGPAPFRIAAALMRGRPPRPHTWILDVEPEPAPG